MQVLIKNAGAAVLGWIVMAVVVFAGHALAWVAMGVEFSFQPDSWSPSTLWSAVSVAISLGAAVLGGVVCAKTAPDHRTVWALAGLVFALGVLAALLPEASVAEGPRPAAVSMMEAMNNAQSPRWMVWLNPLIGAAGALVGGGMVNRGKVAEVA